MFAAFPFSVGGANKLTHRKRDGSVLSYQYDNLNRMTRKTVPSRAGLPSLHTRDVFYNYDLRNLQLGARFDSVNGEGIVNSYDGFGRMLSSQTNMSGLNKTFTYQHDDNGNRTRIVHPDSEQFNYEFDGLNRVNHIKQSTTSLATIAYNNRGSQASLDGGVASTMIYDLVGRLSSLSHDLAGTAADKWSLITGTLYRPTLTYENVGTKCASSRKIWRQQKLREKVVPEGGFEPPTQRFSVACSTN